MPKSSSHRPAANRKHWSAEKLAAVRKIEMLMEFWQIRPSELRGPLPRAAGPEAAGAAGCACGPKYRHPHTGQTWDGVGSQPEWLKQALLKEGLRPEDLRVHNEPLRDTASSSDAAEARA